MFFFGIFHYYYEVGHPSKTRMEGISVTTRHGNWLKEQLYLDYCVTDHVIEQRNKERTLKKICAYYSFIVLRKEKTERTNLSIVFL